jgi:hypothetical protein
VVRTTGTREAVKRQVKTRTHQHLLHVSLAYSLTNTCETACLRMPRGCHVSRCVLLRVNKPLNATADHKRTWGDGVVGCDGRGRGDLYQVMTVDWNMSKCGLPGTTSGG